MALVPSNASWLRIRNAPTRRRRARLVRRIILLGCDVLETERNKSMTEQKAAFNFAAWGEVRGWMANVRTQEFLLSFEIDCL